MTATFLQNILEIKRKRVESQKLLVDPVALKEHAFFVRTNAEPHRLQKSLMTTDGFNIIAEIKRASPSHGAINKGIDVAGIAKCYEKGGACAISILTEEDFFQGFLDDLRTVRDSVTLPILRKDFVFDVFQIYEAAEAGADAILLIAAMLDDNLLEKLYFLADRDLGLDVLMEIHTLEELERVKQIGAKIIGVNNRDLHSFEVSLDISRELIKLAPQGGALMIAESGLKTRKDLVELGSLGFDAFLIGETLMKSEDPERMLKELSAK